MTTATADSATSTNAKYETVIGVEVHVQLKTDAKLFCNSSTHFGADANTHTCPVCLGYPGTLPVLNEKARDLAVKLGLALNCTIAPVSKFDRKHYFYPDLPKGYQISQFDQPLCENGFMELSNGRRIGITRAHLEEDAGKLNHVGADGLAGSLYSLVDLNRAGTPLLEVVSEPDLRSAEEAKEYMSNLRNIVRYLGVCDGNLEEGSMRCDANVSIRPVGTTEFGTRTETKNMNSLRAIERAINYEVARQAKVLDEGGSIRQETRLWNDATGETLPMRGKEAANDYRYFMEADLPPLRIDAEWLEGVRASLPELPTQRYERLLNTVGLPEFESNLLMETKELGDYYDACLALTKDQPKLHKQVANWLLTDINGWLNNEKKAITDIALTPEHLVELVTMLEANTIGSSVGKKLLPELLTNGGSPKALVEAKGLGQINDESALEAMVDEVIAKNPDNVAAYKAGKTKLIGFFVGQIMKASQGKANPEVINKILSKKLAE